MTNPDDIAAIRRRRAREAAASIRAMRQRRSLVARLAYANRPTTANR